MVSQILFPVSAMVTPTLTIRSPTLPNPAGLSATTGGICSRPLSSPPWQNVESLSLADPLTTTKNGLSGWQKWAEPETGHEPEPEPEPAPESGRGPELAAGTGPDPSRFAPELVGCIPMLHYRRPFMFGGGCDIGLPRGNTHRTRGITILARDRLLPAASSASHCLPAPRHAC